VNGNNHGSSSIGCHHGDAWMPSSSLQEWFTERAATLADLENAHRSVRGSGAGSRAAAQQINQAYAVLLSAQFQGFCRDLHYECADYLLGSVADPNLQQTLRDNLLFGRRIDRGNPNPGNIGADFNRLGLVFWPRVDARRPENPARRAALEELSEWRNAIAHQDFSAAMVRAGRPALALAQVRVWRQACNGLARAFDEVLRDHLRTLTGSAPW
jgi:hypothetical protein